jgi:transcriptional adapter 3
MTEDDIKEIYSVAVYPPDDLHELTPGTPPDKDFSNAKPANQVAANTFATFIEPYFRPFTEEDLAFLRERGDRATPFIVPRRGKRHYTEVWAEEDGAMSLDSPTTKLPPNQARGSIENMNDDAAESESISAGPLLSRLLSTMVFENRNSGDKDKPLTNGVSPTAETANGATTDSPAAPPSPPLAPAAAVPNSDQASLKNSVMAKLDYSQIDERLKQELRYIGFIPEDAEPEYDAHYDDEVAGRLRLLQERLRKQILINGARKRRITDAVQQRLAYQEFSAIAEDLDTQVQAAYLKRTRTMSKSKKSTKKPGGAGGGAHGLAAGLSRPGIGDAAKAVMEKRKRWNDAIKPIFDDGLGRIPKESLFDNTVMARMMEKERLTWEEEADE